MTRPRLSPGFLVVCSVLLIAMTSAVCLSGHQQFQVSSLRRSAIVRAVQQARPSVVNIHGQKVVRGGDQYSTEAARRVNGMGTGVVIDGRGYVLTNYHVVDGVRRIRVTTSNGRALIARLVAHDPATDLAVIKIPVTRRMPTINVGSSHDILTGETVIAVGNAYGYEHTVTTGIVSAQHRSVQVNDSQDYHDLIQTDASINPGNSGGPLLNVEGKMIGINVAVRVGAQGIGFAIPVDRAMQVAARLMSVERLSGVWHGLVPEDTIRGDQVVVVVRHIKSGSPAQLAGIKQGDVIQRIDDTPVDRAIDIERALLGAKSGESVQFAVLRGREPVEVSLAVATAPARQASEGSTTADKVWDELGVKLAAVPSEKIKEYTKRFRAGMRVTSARSSGALARQGVRQGDILVGMHTWETASIDDVAYIVTRGDFGDSDSVQFLVLRGTQTLSGQLPVSAFR